MPARESPSERSHRTVSGLQAVVTGAAGGIGTAIVHRLLADGATVHGLDRDRAGLQRLAAACDGGSRLLTYLVDLADRADCDRVLGELLAALEGRCDVLVNNAGLCEVRSLAQSDDRLLDRTFAVNFFAPLRLTRTLLPALRASGRACVVNIASELALIGQPGYGVYSGSKGALLAWSRALAVELAPDRVRVNAVCPGPIDTAMLRAEFVSLGDPSQARAEEIATVPLGRLGVPLDVANVVAFLASAEAAFVSGAAWSVDGGKTSR